MAFSTTMLSKKKKTCTTAPLLQLCSDEKQSSFFVWPNNNIKPCCLPSKGNTYLLSEIRTLMSMEAHRHWLSMLCRTCGNKPTDRAKSKTDYTYQIKSVYNIDIVDDDDVHPRKVCCKCRLRLEHYQEHAKKETFAPRLPAAPQFIPHSTSSDCWVC